MYCSSKLSQCSLNSGKLASQDNSRLHCKIGALSGPIETRARAALEAGCDIVLHCNAKRDEMQAVAGAAGLMSHPPPPAGDELAPQRNASARWRSWSMGISKL